MELINQGASTAVNVLLSSVNLFTEPIHKKIAMEYYFKALQKFSAEPSPEYNAAYEQWAKQRGC